MSEIKSHELMLRIINCLADINWLCHELFLRNMNNVGEGLAPPVFIDVLFNHE